MRPVGPALLEQERHRGAVRILLAGEAGELDDRVRLADHAPEQMLGRLVQGRVGLEILACADQHLLGRHRAATVPAHAIGKHRHHHPGPGRMPEQRHAILLFLAIAQMHGDTGFGGEGHGLR